MRSIFIVSFAVVFCGASLANTVAAADVDPGTEPFWVLLHERAVVDELQLTPDQQKAYQSFLDELDLRFFPLRNRPPEEYQAGMAKVVADARQKLKVVLQPRQLKRLNQILLWRLGTNSLLRDDVVARMKYSESQRQRIKEIIDETRQAAREIRKQVNSGQAFEPLEKKYNQLKFEEQSKISKLLKPEQLETWKETLGAAFNIAALGNTKFKAPELINSKEWINSPQPMSLQKLRGRVVVVHFYACNCINCIHNYPSYDEWNKKFQGQDVTLIGIHTPETDAEKDLRQVRLKATSEKLTFPILVDAKSSNWSAWGNSIWPTVYVIDKQGYLRTYWTGELKWNGNDGEKVIREKIEQLLDEK